MEDDPQGSLRKRTLVLKAEGDGGSKSVMGLLGIFCTVLAVLCGQGWVALSAMGSAMRDLVFFSLVSL